MPLIMGAGKIFEWLKAQRHQSLLKARFDSSRTRFVIAGRFGCACAVACGVLASSTLGLFQRPTSDWGLRLHGKPTPSGLSAALSYK